MRPLHVALVWHMHQPYYRDDRTGEFLLPWARLRAAKDYQRMARLAAEFPTLRISMTMVPSLLEQLAAYSAGDGVDLHRELCRRHAASLTPAERRFLVRTAQATTYGQRTPSLEPLLTLQRGLGGDAAIADHLSTEQLRDLQLWMQLAWIDPGDAADDPHLVALVQRGRGFTEADKELVDDRLMRLVQRAIPEYRRAVEQGVVEPVTSPANHPILPLLVDTDSARAARPSLAVPQPPFRRPEDADEQIRRGLDIFETHVGVRAAGMWPSECAVSPEAVRLIAGAGVGWAISDEGVLAQSLGGAMSRGDLHRPWRDASGLPLVFRDAELSNLVGFVYGGRPGADAAGDIVRRLHAIAAEQPQDRDWLVVIALDGENCWEHYEDDGTPFLRRLYAALTGDDVIRTTHIGEFVRTHPAEVGTLPRLHSGSWIDADYTTWIGDDEHTVAWNLLRDARDALERAGGAATHPQAHREMLVCEGSDWFWWFGRRHDSNMDDAWDALYRHHLVSVYELLGVPVPERLHRPILGAAQRRSVLEPVRAISPRPEHGAADPEWCAAGLVELGAGLGAMHPPRTTMSRLLYGCDPDQLHLRFGDGSPQLTRAEVRVRRDGGPPASIVVQRSRTGYTARTVSEVAGARVQRGRTPRIAATAPLRLTIPLAALGAHPGDTLTVRVTVDEDGRRETIPADSPLTVRVPSIGAHAAAPPEGPLRVAMCAVECTGVARAGGLGDAVAALLGGLTAAGHECSLVIPRHRGAALGLPLGERVADLEVPWGGATAHCRVLQGRAGDAAVYLVDSPAHFDRDGIYGHPDDAERFLFFSRATVEVLRALELRPHAVHCHDWHTAAVAALLHAETAAAATAVTLSLHDAGAQGWAAPEVAERAGLGSVSRDGVNLLALGVEHADVVVVPSRSPERLAADAVGPVLAGALHHAGARVTAVPGGAWARAAPVYAAVYRSAAGIR